MASHACVAGVGTPAAVAGVHENSRHRFLLLEKVETSPGVFKYQLMEENPESALEVENLIQGRNEKARQFPSPPATPPRPPTPPRYSINRQGQVPNASPHSSKVSGTLDFASRFVSDSRHDMPRAWRTAFDRFNKAVDDMYHACLRDLSIEECEVVIQSCEFSIEEFHKLINKIRVIDDYEIPIGDQTIIVTSEPGKTPIGVWEESSPHGKRSSERQAPRRVSSVSDTDDEDFFTATLGAPPTPPTTPPYHGGIAISSTSDSRSVRVTPPYSQHAVIQSQAPVSVTTSETLTTTPVLPPPLSVSAHEDYGSLASSQEVMTPSSTASTPSSPLTPPFTRDPNSPMASWADSVEKEEERRLARHQKHLNKAEQKRQKQQNMSSSNVAGRVKQQQREQKSDFNGVVGEQASKKASSSGIEAAGDEHVPERVDREPEASNTPSKAGEQNTSSAAVDASERSSSTPVGVSKRTDLVVHGTHIDILEAEVCDSASLETVQDSPTSTTIQPSLSPREEGISYADKVKGKSANEEISSSPRRDPSSRLNSPKWTSEHELAERQERARQKRESFVEQKKDRARKITERGELVSQRKEQQLEAMRRSHEETQKTERVSKKKQVAKLEASMARKEAALAEKRLKIQQRLEKEKMVHQRRQKLLEKDAALREGVVFFEEEEEGWQVAGQGSSSKPRNICTLCNVELAHDTIAAHLSSERHRLARMGSHDTRIRRHSGGLPTPPRREEVRDEHELAEEETVDIGENDGARTVILSEAKDITVSRRRPATTSSRERRKQQQQIRGSGNIRRPSTSSRPEADIDFSHGFVVGVAGASATKAASEVAAITGTKACAATSYSPAVLSALSEDDISKLRERERAARRHYKKLRQRISSKAMGWADSFPERDSPHKARLQKLAQEMHSLSMGHNYAAMEESLSSVFSLFGKVGGTHQQEDLHLLRQLGGLDALVKLATLQGSQEPKLKHRQLAARVTSVALHNLHVACGLEYNEEYLLDSGRLLPLIHLLDRSLLCDREEPCVVPLLTLISRLLRHPVSFTEKGSVKDDFISYIVDMATIDRLQYLLKLLLQPGIYCSEPVVPKYWSSLQLIYSALDFIHCVTSLGNTLPPGFPVYNENPFRPDLSRCITKAMKITHIVGLLSLLVSLLHERDVAESASSPRFIHPELLPIVLVGLGIMNDLTRLDLDFVQELLSSEDSQMGLYQLFSIVIPACTDSSSTNATVAACTASAAAAIYPAVPSMSAPSFFAPELLESVLVEAVLFLGCLSLRHVVQQRLFHFGDQNLLQKLCGLPFKFFSDPVYKNILFPTLVSVCFENQDNLALLSQEVSSELFLAYLKDEALTYEASDPRLSFASRFPVSLIDEAVAFFAGKAITKEDS